MANRQLIAAARLKRAGGSLFAGTLSDYLSAQSRQGNPLTLQACGDKLDENLSRNVTQWMYIPARTVLAQMIADYYCRRTRNLDQGALQARIWAELVATWAVDGDGTLDDMERSRNEINNILSNNPPDADTVLAAWQSVYNQTITDAPLGTIQWAEAAYTMPPNEHPPQVVPIQKYNYCLASAHAFLKPSLFVVPANVAPIIENLQDIDEEVVQNIPEHNWVINNNYGANWAVMPINQKLAVLEMLFKANEEPYKSQALAAVVGSLYTLCKSSNVSDAWLTTQLNRIKMAYPALEITTKVTSDSMNQFKQSFIPDAINPSILSNFLQAIYPALDQNQMICLSWVIEQTRGHSCTHASAFSDTISEFNGAPLLYLNRVPDQQILNFARLATIVIVDPWSTIQRPAIPAREYADLANFGWIAKRNMDREFKKYMGSFIKGGVYRENELLAIFEICRTTQEARMDEDTNPASLINKIMPGLSASVIGTDVFVSDGTNRRLLMDETSLSHYLTLHNQQRQEPLAGNVGAPMDVEQPAGNDQVPENAPEGGPDFQPPHLPGGPSLHGELLPEVTDEALAQSRADWPRSAKNLPRNAVRIGPSVLDLIVQCKIRADPKMTAILDICQLLSAAVQQNVLTPYGDDPTNIQVLNRYVYQTTDKLANALNYFGLEIETIVPGYTPNVDPVPYNPNTMLTEGHLAKPRRPCIPEAEGAAAAPPPVPGPAPDGDDQGDEPDGNAPRGRQGRQPRHR